MTGTRPHFNGSSLVGSVLGNYRITHEISKGGMGTVYRAEHELLGRTAAVKLLRPELTTNDEQVERFFNEAKAATAIRHPGIIEVYDFGYTSAGTAYLVMEFLEGEVLARKLATRGRFAEAEAVSLARGIASALKAAHGKGIVHRDLKPDNVFVVPDPDGPTGERVKVLDFGIAKLVDTAASAARRTQTGELIGTPRYMAPEQARAASTIDHRADLYSLGCILYEMLVGQPPFVAEGDGEVIALQLFAQPEPPSARVGSISPELERIVMCLLAKEPDQRFSSAGDVIAALDGSGVAQLAASARSGAGLDGPSTLPSSGLRLSLIDEGPPQLPAKRSWMPLIAGVLTIAIAGATTVFVLTRSSNDEPMAAVHPDAGSSAPAASAPATAPPPPAPPPPRAAAAPTRPAIPAKVDPPRRRDRVKASARDRKRPDKPRRGAQAPVTSPGLDSSGPVTRPGGAAATADPASTPVTTIERDPPAGSAALRPTTDKGSPIDLGTEPLDEKQPAKEP